MTLMAAQAVIAETLVDHTRLRPPSGVCSCGHEVPLGCSFAEHQAAACVDALTRLSGSPMGDLTEQSNPLLEALLNAGVLKRRKETFNGYHCGYTETWLETARERVEWSDDGGTD